MSAAASPRIRVVIPEGLEDVTPTYLESKKRELALFRTWIAEKNFVEIEKASHKLKGSAGGYGLEDLGHLAKDMNLAAKAHDSSNIETVLRKMEMYFDQVELVHPGT